MSQHDMPSNSIKKANTNNEAQGIIDDIDNTHKELGILQTEIDKVIFGQNHAIEYALITIFLVDMPFLSVLQDWQKRVL